MIKVAILSPLPESNAETFIQNHIQNLPFEVVVIYGGRFPHLAKGHRFSRTQKILFRIKNEIKKAFGGKVEDLKTNQLKKILIKEKVDVVFGEYLFTGAEVMNVCEGLKIPVTSIALGYEISKHKMLKVYKEKYINLFDKAAAIFVVSNHMKQNILALNCSEEKIIYTPAGPDAEFFELSPKFKKSQILAVGRFVDKKAPHLTILAFQKVIHEIPEAKLIMAGDGPLLNACKDLVEVLNLTNSVDFIGRISREQHRSLLEESFMFVQHSKIADNGDSEGTPVAILEASAAKIPVISTVHAGIPDVVIDGETGYLVPENDIDLMGTRMIELLSNKEKAKRLGRQGHNFVKANFSLEKHLEIISTKIEEIIKKK